MQEKEGEMFNIGHLNDSGAGMLSRLGKMKEGKRKCSETLLL